MTAPVILLAYAVIASVAGARVLSRAQWVRRSPRWGIWAWQSLTLSVATSAVLAGLCLALPVLPIRDEVAGLVQTTPFHVVEHYTTPAGFTLAVGALLVTLVLLGRIVWMIGSRLLDGARQRRLQLESLRLVGDQHPGGFTVIDHDTPAVYCLPGLRGTVVVTSAALGRLDERSLGLVLRHERTHLRARHDLALTVSSALASAFVGCRIFARADEQITTLVEMHADDAARSADDRRILAHALLTLCSRPQAMPGLAAGDVSALARVQRLTTTGSPPWCRRHAAVVALASAVLISTPILLALAPAVEAGYNDCWGTTDCL